MAHGNDPSLPHEVAACPSRSSTKAARPPWRA